VVFNAGPQNKNKIPGDTRHTALPGYTFKEDTYDKNGTGKTPAADGGSTEVEKVRGD
jgi:hypothetical protein